MPMLVIRDEQMRILHDVQIHQWICDYLRQAYPGRSRRLGARLTELVATAMREARGRGIQDGGDLRKYAHIEFLLGPRFADHFPWANKILVNRAYHHSGARLRALEDAAIRYLEKAGAEKKN